MKLHAIDVAIIIAYFATVISIGLWVSRRGVKSLGSYVLGGRALPWYLLGVSNASGMFDVSGTMWQVYVGFIYGLKATWLPFLWPAFNQIFLMVFMSGWTRRSKALTGAEWIETRFGRDAGANLAHLSVVLFAIVNVVGLLAYAFKGIGKFAVVMLPWRFTHVSTGLFSDENVYAAMIMGLTSIYAIKGGMISVVVTEVTQFGILTISSIAVGAIAMWRVAPRMIEHSVPAGWMSPFFGWKLNLDWTGILDTANGAIRKDGWDFFFVIFWMMVLKGVLASLAGPAPNYDMQRILATRNPREACLMSGLVNVVLMLPSYIMSTGIIVLALAFCMPELRAMDTPDFEKLLPMVLSRYVPMGMLGVLLAGLIAAFMSNFAATLNAAPAYLVNDIYKRFINPAASERVAVNLTRLASLLILAVGIVFGLLTDRITDVMMWLVGSLYSGFVMANVLKWYWWRFNGYGYFWGMVSGIVSAMIVPVVAKRMYGDDINMIYTFPAIFGISTAFSFLGALWTKPEDDAILMRFYKNVRPWGWWGRIRDLVMLEDPDFRPNRDCARDWVNVAVGIVWQVCLVTMPTYLVLRNWTGFWISAIIVAITSIFMKFNWYDRLEKAPADPTPGNGAPDGA
ncbi:MAG TPA: sodium:solute symporter family protein [Opitutaceae bacterium]|nr:sodium:solute symporter family protein [Opitutaceae bacterium]